MRSAEGGTVLDVVDHEEENSDGESPHNPEGIHFVFWSVVHELELNFLLVDLLQIAEEYSSLPIFFSLFKIDK